MSQLSLVLLALLVLASCTHVGHRSPAAESIQYDVKERVVAQNVANLETIIPTSGITTTGAVYYDASDAQTAWYFGPGYYADWCRDHDGKALYSRIEQAFHVQVCEFLSPSLSVVREYLRNNYPDKIKLLPVPITTTRYSGTVADFYGSANCVQDEQAFSGADYSYTCEIMPKNKRFADLIEGIDSHSRLLFFTLSVTFQMSGAINKYSDDLVLLDYGTKESTRSFTLPILSAKPGGPTALTP